MRSGLGWVELPQGNCVPSVSRELETPEAVLRLIFAWFQLQVRYDKQTNLARVQVSISETHWIGC